MRPRTSRTVSVACARLHEGAAAPAIEKVLGRFPRFAIRNCVGPGRAVRHLAGARSSSPPRAQEVQSRRRPRRGRRTQSATAARAAARSAAFHRLHRRRPGPQNPCQREVFAVSSRISSVRAHGAWRRPGPQALAALALVCVAFFMVILDVAIVNVALPSIQEDLGISRDTLQWIVTAYSLAFGGFCSSAAAPRISSAGARCSCSEWCSSRAAHSPAGSPTAGRN